MRKTVECAVALLMLLVAFSAATERNWLDLPTNWGIWLIAPRAYLPEKEYPPEIADEMKRLKERNNALFDLNETPPFPCYGYETVAPWDSVQELPLFVGNSSTPCYPCAPRTVLRWNARSDVDDSAYGRGSFGEDGKRFFSTFLHPLKERVGRPSLAEWEWNGIGPDYFGRERFLATLVFAFVSDPGYSRTVDHDELECRSKFGEERQADYAVEVSLKRNGRGRELEFPSLGIPCAWAPGGSSGIGPNGGYSRRTLTDFETLLESVAKRWTFPGWMTDASVEFFFIDVGHSDAMWHVELKSELEESPAPGYCDIRRETARELYKRWRAVERGLDESKNGGVATHRPRNCHPAPNEQGFVCD